MTEEAGSSTAPFDLEKLKTLIGLMEQHGLSEVSLRRGEEEWRIKRGGFEGIPVAPYPAPIGAMAGAAAGSPAASAASPEAAKTDDSVFIKSPTVGTFYASPSPEDPPFVRVGSVVTPDTVVCIVEAMKVFNQIPAEVSGTIVEVLRDNGDSVEYGQPIFRVRPG